LGELEFGAVVDYGSGESSAVGNSEGREEHLFMLAQPYKFVGVGPMIRKSSG